MKPLVIALALLAMYCACSYSADEKSESATATSGAVYTIYVGTHGDGAGYVLENVDAVDFKGVKCLKGSHVNLTWARGKVCYVPVDKIDLIMEFASFDAYKNEIREHRDNELE